MFCTKCGSPLSSDAIFCPKCGGRQDSEGEHSSIQVGSVKLAQSIMPSSVLKPEEGLAQAMLMVPFVACLLIWFWVGSMSLFQGPASSLALVNVTTVIVTAALGYADAKRLGIGSPSDPRKGLSPEIWFAYILLLWIVGYPAYLRERKRYGARSYLIVGILVALLLALSAVGMAIAINEQQEKLRNIFH
jgi:uncharacterized Zn finger protein (UPF0148 family)